MTAFLLMNAAVIMTAGILTYKVFKFRGLADSLAIFLILAFSQITVTQLALGIAKALTLKNVIYLNLMILAAVWFFCRKKKSHSAFSGSGTKLCGLLNNKAVMFAAAAILGFGITKVLVNLANPPFGWDSLNYHFTFAVEWLKHGNLDTPITIADDPSPTYYPVNGSLFFLWLTWPFKNVFLADLGQLPFFMLAFLAVFGIARKTGLEQKPALFSAALFTLIPNYFKQLQIAYVDVMVAGLFLACLNFLFLLNENFSLKNTLAYAMSLGLLIGTKTVALPYSLLLIVPFLYMCCKNAGRLRPLVIFVLATFILGGFSYLRNFLETGNPLYPLNLHLFGKEILKGVMDSKVYAAHFRIEDYRIDKLLFHEGLGLQTLIFIFPAVFLALPLAIIKNKDRTGWLTLYLLALPFLGYLIYRYTIPLANTRYLYPVLACGMIAGFYMLKTLNIPAAAINFFAALSIIASMAELAKRQELIAGLLSSLALLPFLWLVSRRKKPAFYGRPALTVILACVFILFLAATERSYQRNEFKNYLKMVKYSGFWPDAAKAWIWLNENTTRANIAYTGRPVPFPLYGSNFKNNVYYVSVNRVEPVKLHYFPDSHYRWGEDFLELHKNMEEEGNYRGHAEYEAWLANLLKRKTDFLFIYSLHQTKETLFPVEESWAAANPVRFTPAFRNGTIRIYKIIR